MPLGTYFLASPLTDAKRMDVHWPLIGYLALLPLLPLLPAVLRAWAARGRGSRVAARAAPGLALLVLGFVIVDVLALPWGELPPAGFLGWADLNRMVGEHLEPAPDEAGAVVPPKLVVADNYITASELAFHLGPRAVVYTLHQAVNDAHGRGLQFELWQRDEFSLAA